MKKFNRKLNKLRNNPRKFFIDMRKKYENKFPALLESAYIATNQFSVISAVYNVEKYLDDYFESLVQQTIGFKKNIRLILVDDGSTDDSAKIINKWKKRYPENIEYIYKKNGGQASARNEGLRRVRTEWVTFIDPDDFVSKEYFSEIDSFIAKSDKLPVDMICCKMIVYREDLNEFIDAQPLSFCFDEPVSLCSAKELDDKIQLSASSAIFKKKYIESNNCIFDEKVKPNFEDGKFLLEYMQNIVGKVAFINRSKYYYRSRGDGTSTSDTQWSKKEKFLDVIEYGIIDMLQSHSEQYDKIPRHAQRTAIYFLVQYFKIFTNSSKLNFLSEIDKDRHLELMDKAFSYIDSSEIMKFNLLGCRYYEKVGMNSIFKKQDDFSFQMAYVDHIDIYRNEIKIHYYSHGIENESIRLDNREIVPVGTKTIYHTYLGRSFCERIIWLKYDSPNQKIHISLNKKVYISVFGESFNNEVEVYKILKLFEDKYIDKNIYINDRLSSC